MITTGYVRTMSSYNAEMNRRLYAAAGRLSDAERRRDRGAFWRSIHGTLSHLVWADRAWMSRFAGWDAPAQPLSESDRCFTEFAALAEARIADDARIAAWAATLDDGWLAADLTWHSGSADATMTAPRALLLMHLFNHQTHHRGQAHAMLTAAGETTGATDLPFVLPDGGVRQDEAQP